MIIDLLNFLHYYPGTEANVLFRLQENGISVPPFFCITKDFTEDELNNYLQNHYQQTEHFAMRVSLSFKGHKSSDLPYSPTELPYRINVPKSALEYTAKKLFDKTQKLLEKNASDSSEYENITAHIIIQEFAAADIFGNLYTACSNCPINETVIYTAHPHNANYLKHDNSYCTYCHNDTDGVLFGHEPENAEKAGMDLIKSLLELSENIKNIFNNVSVDIKFMANRKEKKIYIISVGEINGLKSSTAEKIVLDTAEVCYYYPGITAPLHASAVMAVSRNMISSLINRTGNYKTFHKHITEINEYVNGRLYINTNKLECLKKDLYINTGMEEFIRPNLKTFISQLKECGSIAEWRKKHKIVLKIIRMLEENLKQSVSTRKKLDISLRELLSYSKSTSLNELQEMLKKVMLAQSKCVYVNSLNALYIKFKKNSMANLRAFDKKYKEAEESISKAYLYRDELRRYIYSFMKLLNLYGLQLGNELSKRKLLENSEDVFMLTYDEISAPLDDVNIDFQQIVKARKREFDWYKSMPGFSKLVFLGEIMNAPVGKVDFICSVKNESYIRGCGMAGGKAEGSAVICKDDIIPESTDSSKIYVVNKFTAYQENMKIGGLIAMEQPIFSNIDLDITKFNFPLIYGAEHALEIIGDDDIVVMDGISGEVFIKHINN